MVIYGYSSEIKSHSDHPFVKENRVRVTTGTKDFAKGQHGVVTKDHYINCVKVRLDNALADINIPVRCLELVSSY
jgi:hypothetical protein